LYRAHNEAHRQGLLRSSHTPTAGGLAVAFTLCALGGDCGVEVDLDRVPVSGTCTRDGILFSESNSRFILTCAPEQAAALEATFTGLPLARVGQVTAAGAPVQLRSGGSTPVNLELERARSAFRRTLHGL
jgi:phosphoribosylformylglycinamidine synthase subunit PurSL